jgi:hypothetical protein
MKHDPYGDNIRLTTAELTCALMARIDASDCLLTLLALMIEASGALPVDRQWRMAGSLRDAAQMIEARPKVRGLVDLLKLTPAYDGEGATP